MKAYTDYPLCHREEYKLAPIREVTIISYDRNKYCKIEFNHEVFEVKSGYLYKESKRMTNKYSPKRFSRQELCSLPEGEK